VCAGSSESFGAVQTHPDLLGVPADVQKSHRGIIQRLLCQIFPAYPDIVNAVCPDHQSNEPWGMRDLMQALEKLTKGFTATTCFCFFIDALDEYDDQETEIIETLRSKCWLFKISQRLI
jgi:hypothetical protein